MKVLYIFREKNQAIWFWHERGEVEENAKEFIGDEVIKGRNC